jgi:hypothetical protein
MLRVRLSDAEHSRLTELTTVRGGVASEVVRRLIDEAHHAECGLAAIVRELVDGTGSGAVPRDVAVLMAERRRQLTGERRAFSEADAKKALDASPLVERRGTKYFPRQR